MAATGTQENTTRQPVQKAIQSNLVIQNALAAEATQLEAQLKQLDELVEAVNRAVVTEEVSSGAFEGELQIPGSKRVNSPIASFGLLSQSSPFCREASQRAHYVRWTTAHPIKAEVLSDAVKKENMRLKAYRARNDPTAPPIDIETNVEGINWSIVAEKVTNGLPIRRTPDECRIQWVGNLHPKINHGDWTQDEENKLHELTASSLATGGKINWTRIAQELGTNRIPLECMKRATTRPRHHWDATADQKLREAVQKFGTNNWNIVARQVSPYATTSQCQTRYFRSVDPSIKRESWTSEEDNRLRKAVEVYENSWVDVAGVLPGRTNEQCRERWAEIGVNEGGKGAWSAEEDQRLWDAAEELGKKWKEISKRVGGGRTGPNCRLRHGRLVKIRAGQAEVASAPGAGPSRALSIGTSTAPTETPASTSRPISESESPAPAPIPVSTPALISTSVPPKPKARPRRKPKAPPLSTPNDGIQEDVPGPSTALQPLEAPLQRPRPRPRPVYKGKGKCRADVGDTTENAETSSEQQSFIRSIAQTVDTGAGGGSGSQVELVRESGVGGVVTGPYQLHAESMSSVGPGSLQLDAESLMSGAMEGPGVVGEDQPIAQQQEKEHESDQRRKPRASRGGKRRRSEGEGGEEHTEGDQNANGELEVGGQLQPQSQRKITRKRRKASAVAGE
ncbi:hypothetical protein P691DRAFT_758628 [Macrolepiota fuliginosa MF-IS2]|uniref:Uncharacterized protein n=1 Tax=Macrolepiota fuliginosa MF-IS2 TaxID=1400762 RepID=A0A9P5XIL5_9AGAR|nr:hypothetical protein P691DRAFT_758628 [Macrolepiota fuliginosa MF-IS2]